MNLKAAVRLVSYLVLVAMVASACAAPAATKAPASSGGGNLLGQSGQEAAAATEEPAPAEGERGAASTGGSDFAAAPDAVEEKSAGFGEGMGGGPSNAAEPPVISADGSTASGGETVVKPPSTGFTPPDQQFQQSLTAGEVDDNKDFSAYLQYRTDYMRFNGAPVHDVDVSERHAIRVRTANGLPVLGAEVMVYDGQNLVAALKTTATGVAYFFPNAARPGIQAQSFNVTVEKNQASRSFNLTRQNADDVWDITLPVEPTRAPVKLDVLFLLDSTGSMGDEIAQIKDNLLSISAQITALPSRPDVRFGMVTYRDRGDAYITRVSDFTSDVQDFQSVLGNVRAAGGGDEPESLNEALNKAINGQLRWRMDPDAVRLVFLVADAPPHLDYPQDYDYAQEMIDAAAYGIKIEPIAASNTSDSAEYVFRQLAQYTGGHFIFLTYSDTPQSSGEPGTTHHVQEGTYTVDDLDALVVKLVQDELAQLAAAPGQQ